MSDWGNQGGGYQQDYNQGGGYGGGGGGGWGGGGGNAYGGSWGGGGGFRGGGGNVRPGDWQCPAGCGNVFASKMNCFRCGMPKPEGAGGDQVRVARAPARREPRHPAEALFPFSREPPMDESGRVGRFRSAPIRRPDRRSATDATTRFSSSETP